MEKKKLLIASMSGGLDSATMVAHALAEGYDIQPIVFEYGQKNFIELVAQKRLVEHFGNQYPGMVRQTVTIDTTKIIQKFVFDYQELRDNDKILDATGEKFYTPSRNLMFMTICTVIGEIIAFANGYTEIAIGLGIHKHSAENYKKDYWDITPEFAIRLQHLLELNDSVQVTVYSPFVDQFKSGIISRAMELNLPVYLTWSCYDPDRVTEETHTGKITYFKPCLECEACLERESQAKKIGIYDINNYQIRLQESNPSS